MKDELDRTDETEMTDADRERLERGQRARALVAAANVRVVSPLASAHREKTRCIEDVRKLVEHVAQSDGVVGGLMSIKEVGVLLDRCADLLSTDTPKAETTLKDYASKFERLEREVLEDYEGSYEEALSAVLRKYSQSGSSFRAYRSALCWGLRERVHDILDRLRAVSEPQEVGGVWWESLSALKRCLEQHAMLHAVQRSPSLPKDERVQRGAKKKQHLRLISTAEPGWMEKMAEGMKDTGYTDAVSVLQLTGARPDELATGISISRHGADRAVFAITGSKVTHVAGQPRRRITVPIDRLPDSWKRRLAASSSFKVKIDSKDGLRRSLQRVSQKVLPNLPAATAYVFRHAFATSLREDGRSIEEIAMFLGHSVAETQKDYGWRTTHGRRRRPNLREGYQVSAPRAVRMSTTNDLEKLLAAKGKQKRSRPKS